jgi:hypothetical protein
VIESDWKAGWEEVIARMVLAMPTVAFAGLGTPVGVLIETVKRIRAALPQETEIVIADPTPRADSAYAAELDLGDDRYVRAGWSAFMRELGKRLVAEHQAALLAACAELHESEGLDDEGAAELCGRAAGLGLIGLGRLRAEWLLSRRPYLPARQVNAAHVADLLLAVGTVERALTAESRLGEDGLVEFWIEDRRVAVVRLGSGLGARRWLSLQDEIRRRPSRVRPTLGIASGFAGPRVTASPPTDVVRGGNISRSIITGPPEFSIVAADDVRNDPGLVSDAIAPK